MAVVPVNPPAVAQPDSQVAEQDAGDVAGPPGAENLPVPGVVAQEPGLGEDHRQEHGTASCHLELPATTKTVHPAASSPMVTAIFQAQ
jgi:hypothetical protein